MAVNKRFVSPLLAFFVLIFFSVPAPLFSEDSDNPPNFHTRLDQASQELLRGDEKKGETLFEKLITDNPDEFLVYEVYAHVRKERNEWDAARKIYERALLPVSAKSPAMGENIKAKLIQMNEIQKFKKLMESAPVWKDAKTIGTPHFAIRTNIPQTYYEPFAQRLEAILQKEKEILEKFFDKPIDEFPYTQIFVVGRLEDYRAFLKEQKAKDESIPDHIIKGYYMTEDESMVVYFEGDCDWRALAHEMMHFLIRKFFVKNPSSLLDEGLAEYIAVKVEKEGSREELDTKLNIIRWWSDQGEIQSLDEIFNVWKEYQAHNHFNAANAFYAMALTLAHYFLEKDDASVKQIFLAWIKYEAENENNTLEFTRYFFEHELSKEQYKKIEDGWLRHLSNLTYETL